MGMAVVFPANNQQLCSCFPNSSTFSLFHLLAPIDEEKENNSAQHGPSRERMSPQTPAYYYITYLLLQKIILKNDI